MKDLRKNNKLTQFSELKDFVVENSLKEIPLNKKKKGNDRQLGEF